MTSTILIIAWTLGVAMAVLLIGRGVAEYLESRAAIAESANDGSGDEAGRREALGP